jgi:predicted TIM-barrel fold metal-dependent hydrolase
MTTRRSFLSQAGALAGVVFTGCSLIPEANAQRARRTIAVAGKPIKTVDVHAHCVIPEAVALMGQKIAPVYAHSYEDRIKRMDDMGIEVQALSINPTWYALERDLVTKAIDLQNEKLAEVCAQHPDRFVAFATVALQYPDLAARQLEQAVKKLNLRGAAIGGSVEGMELSDPKLHPFWQKVEELGVLVFIHPQRTSDLDNRLKGNGGLDNTIWNPLETTLALSHLIYEGTLDRFPGLKICGAHGGGYLPSYADRSDHICITFPDRCKAVPLKKKPTEYLRQLYFDSLVFTPEALRHLAAQVGPSQLVLGTDDPFGWTKTPIEHVMSTPELSDAQRRAILGETAEKLLGMRKI